jgi:hypothetical protein
LRGSSCQNGGHAERKMMTKILEVIAALFIGAWLYVMLVFVMSF